MEASTAIGFQTILAVSELGLSHAQLACLYGNLLNGCQGLCPKTFTRSLPTICG